jgi:hypothetical protein
MQYFRSLHNSDADGPRFNGAELLLTIFLTFKRWTGKYFYCLTVATLGVLVYQINVFMMIFAPHLNHYGIIACIGIGWSMMVTGQSLVLWSRLHLVCRSVWKLRLILCMIIINGVCMHGPQFVFSLLVSRSRNASRKHNTNIRSRQSRTTT